MNVIAREKFMRGQIRAFALVAGIMMAAAMSSSAMAASLRQGATGGAVTGSLPGEVLWNYYLAAGSNGDFCPPGSNLIGDLCNTEGEGDNIIRLINPNGAANGNLAGAKEQEVCAMIYVFDDDEEMGECCGCPLSSTQLATFSVLQNLTSNWGIQGPGSTTEAGTDNSNGSFAIVAAAPNATSPTSCAGQSAACNGGCDPTNIPGYSVTSASNLLGSITHNQAVAQPPSGPVTFGLTETTLSDDGSGDPTNLIYLQNQCGALVGNGTGGGICNCPVE